MIKGFQVLPIHKDTFLGIATNEKAKKNRLVRAFASGNITFHFSTGDKVIAVSGGEDFSMEENCTGITSTANILMS